MSGGQRLAHYLADRLGFRYARREDLLEVVDSRGEHARKVRETLDRATRAYDHFSQLRRPFLVYMRHALLGFIRAGNLVYDGYASHLLVSGIPGCMRVRVGAPLDVRARNAMERLGVTAAEAREAVLREDEERVRWVRFVYGRDIRDPALYDVCFSLERTSIETAGSMVVAGLEGAEFRDCDANDEALEDIWLGASVEAALVTDARTLAWEIGARARGGNLMLEGPFLEEPEVANVLSVAKSVEGVSSVEYQPGCARAFC